MSVKKLEERLRNYPCTYSKKDVYRLLDVIEVQREAL